LSIWGEVFFGPDVRQLKERALQLHGQLQRGAGWLEKRRIRSQLVRVLDEIEYQEGRKQYANRPYTKPPAYPPGMGCKKTLDCKCGCWIETRKAIGI